MVNERTNPSDALSALRRQETGRMLFDRPLVAGQRDFQRAVLDMLRGDVWSATYGDRSGEGVNVRALGDYHSHHPGRGLPRVHNYHGTGPAQGPNFRLAALCQISTL